MNFVYESGQNADKGGGGHFIVGPLMLRVAGGGAIPVAVRQSVLALLRRRQR